VLPIPIPGSKADLPEDRFMKAEDIASLLEGRLQILD
jgi:hypothetical protein